MNRKQQRHLPGFLFILLLLSFAYPVLSQRTYKDLQEALSSQGKLTGRGGPASVDWIENGKRFSFIDNKGVIKAFDPADAKEDVVFDAAQEMFPGTQNKFAYESFEWSNDFKFIVFRTNIRQVWRNSGIADYYIYSLDGKKLTLLAKDAYTAQLSPDGKKVGYEHGGDLYVMELSTGKTSRLTDDARDFFYNGRFGWAYEEEFGLVQAWEWSHDSKYIAFWQSDETKVPIYQYTDYVGFKEVYNKLPYPRVGDTNPQVRIGVIDVNTRKKQWMKVNSGDGYIPRIYWTAEEKQLAVVQLNRKQNHMQIFFADVLTGEAKQVFEEKSDQWLEIFSFPARILHYLYFPADSKEFFWRSERDGWPHMYRYDYNGKLINQVTSGNFEMIKMFVADAKTKTMYYLSTENSPLERQLYSIGFDGKNKKQITAVPGVHNIDFSPNAQYYIDRYSNINTPRKVGLYDNTGKLIKEFENNASVTQFTKEVYYSPWEVQQFTNSDGIRIDIGVVKPYNFSADKKYPVLLMVYGGPEFQDVTNSFFADGWAQYLSQQGYIIVKVNNRGGEGYGVPFKKSVYGKLGFNESKDFAEAAQYITRFPWADKSRVGIYGHSYGGFTSAFTMLNYPDIFKASIVASPVTDYRNYDAIYTERYMGVLPENLSNYENSSVNKYAGNLKGNMMIAHSTSDDNVHVRNTMQLLKALIDHGKDADLRLYQSGGHGIYNDFNSYLLLRKQYTEFLDKHLKN